MGKVGIYLLANYPSRETFLEAVKICAREHIDFLEIGFPFSDPVADGDVLETACCKTLKSYTTDDAVNVFQDVRKTFRGKLYIMTYANILHNLVVNRSIEKLGKISGIILPDVPSREAKRFQNFLKRNHIPLIRFITPESRAAEIDDAVRNSRNFIYCVSKRGTTGGTFSLADEMLEKIKYAKEKGGLVFVGFGITDEKDLRFIFEYADGAVIGTAALKALNLGLSTFGRYIAGLRG